MEFLFFFLSRGRRIFLEGDVRFLSSYFYLIPSIIYIFLRSCEEIRSPVVFCYSDNKNFVRP